MSSETCDVRPPARYPSGLTRTERLHSVQTRSVGTGANADDLVAGFRPGIRATALRAAVTPLADVGSTVE
jgi:PP-loop superfamily ATP-utilizing enzyme